MDKKYNRDAIIRCDKNDCTNLHSFGPAKRTIYAIHYVLRGTGYCIYDGQKYTLRPGETFVVFPGPLVQFYPDPNDPWEYIWVGFFGRELETLLQELQYAHSPYILGYIAPEQILPYYELLYNLEDCKKNAATADGLLRAILGVYRDTFPKKIDKRFSTALWLIRENYADSCFGVPEMLEKLKISKATLYRLFREEKHAAPGAYLQNYRIDRAKTLLEHDETVSAAALACGFWSIVYFSRVFRQREGIPPATYRKQCTGNDNKSC